MVDAIPTDMPEITRPVINVGQSCVTTKDIPEERDVECIRQQRPAMLSQ